MDTEDGIHLGASWYAPTPAAAALFYEGLGYRAVPLRPGTKLPALAIKGNPMVESQTAEDVKRLFWLGRRWNVALWLTEEQTYLDLDRDHAGGKDGIETMRAYGALHGPLPPTWVVHTPRGGLHLTYRDPGRLLAAAGLIKNKTGCAVNGIDYRAPGKGLEVVPGTHIDGVGDYLWDDELNPWSMPCGEVDAAVVAFVGWLYDQVDSASRPKPSLAVKPAKGSLRLTRDRDCQILVGERNESLFRMLCSARSLGASDGSLVDRAYEINETLMEEPLGDEEVDSIVASACCYEQGTDYYAMADALFNGNVAREGANAPVVIPAKQ